MKTTVLFVGTSLILVIAMVAIAVPNAVQADKKFEYCYRSASGVHCDFQTKGECKKALKEDTSEIVTPCAKVPIR